MRNIKFDQDRYDSFIALQDKLHQNLARQRTLVSIGTHDLDTIKGPFTYEALPPEQINFIPLNQEKQMNGKELMEFYEVRRLYNIYIYITHKLIRFSMTNISADIFTLSEIPLFTL